MPNKGDHPLLSGLIGVVNQRLNFTGQETQLHKQLQWLIDSDRLLDLPVQPDQPSPIGRSVGEAVDRYLRNLRDETDTSGNENGKSVDAHTEKTIHSHW